MPRRGRPLRGVTQCPAVHSRWDNPINAEGRLPGRPARTLALRLALLLSVAGLLSCDWITALGNDPPGALGTIPDQIVEVDSAVTVDPAGYFEDPDGDSLSYNAVSAAPVTAAAAAAGGMLTVTGVSKGETRVTVTASDPDGLTATQSFAVTVPNRGPVAVGAIPDGEVFVDRMVVIDLGAYFTDPDGDDLTYLSSSSDTSRATAVVSESTVTLTGMAVGAATVTVSARDPAGLAVEQSFAVTVPNRAPAAVGTIDDRELEVDSVVELDVAPFFADPDRDSLVYATASSDSARAMVALSGSTLTVTGVAKGGTTVTVTATDPGGLSAEQGFAVTVPNRPPFPADTIGNRELFVGDEVEIDVAAHFDDPDGDPLEYAAASSDTTRAMVALEGGLVTLSGVAVGDATVTVKVRDPEGLEAEQAFGVTVPNRAPEPVGAIADRDVYVGDTVTLDVAAYFTEPDGETLAYEAVSSGATIATVTISGSAVTVAAFAVGAAAVTVTAQDPHGMRAGQRFAVTVPNRAPDTVGEIADRVVEVDSVMVIDVADRFTEPDGEALEYAATSSDPARVAVAMTGSVVTVAGVAKGAVTVTVRV